MPNHLKYRNHCDIYIYLVKMLNDQAQHFCIICLACIILKTTITEWESRIQNLLTALPCTRCPKCVTPWWSPMLKSQTGVPFQ